MKDTAVLPKYSSVNTRIQHALNKQKANTSMTVYRHGMTLMWKVAARKLRECRVKKMGTYDKKNAHGGKMWGWPKEMNLTNKMVQKVMFAVIQSRKLNYPQLEIVRKSLGYAWQLNPRKTQDQMELTNWPCMARVWKTIPKGELPKRKQKEMMKIPTVGELEAAFKNEWTPAHPMSLGEFVQGTVAAYDTFIWGCRAKEDHDRIKKSREHVIRPKAGYISTEYVNGRCKSPGFPREWKKYTVCLCPGRKHKSPAPHFKDSIAKGMPTHGVDWCTTCPVACLEFIWTHDKAKGKTYAKALKGSTFGAQNESDIPSYAIKWMKAQGACTEEEPYSHESGRKSLAAWCSEYQIEYKDSFQIHQDLPQCWKDNYQHDMPASTFKERNQSKHPDTCMAALRTLGMNWKRGIKVKQPLSKEGRLMYHLLKRNDPRKAERIRMGLHSESDSEDSDLTPKVEVDPPVAPKSVTRAKRKRAPIKQEPEDPEFFPRPAAKRRKTSKRKQKTQKPKPKPTPKPKNPKPKPKPKPKAKKRKPSKRKKKPTPKKRKRT